MTDIDDTLDARAVTHGGYPLVALTGHTIKATLRAGARWSDTQPVHREALDMIAVKMSRIVNGDCNNADHWRDIAGYARLVERLLPREAESGQ
jgi:hypothetical protein